MIDSAIVFFYKLYSSSTHQLKTFVMLYVTIVMLVSEGILNQKTAHKKYTRSKAYAINNTSWKTSARGERERKL